MLLKVAFLFTVAISIAVASSDPCNSHHSCPSCVASPFCGWCSTKVVYKDGAPGHHCAGIAKNDNGFVCNGVYSTEQCEPGYMCNTSTYTCDKTAPGTGETKDQCEANCSTVGKTFSCNTTTHQCYEAIPGKGTSLPICEASCKATQHPESHAPASHHPASMHPASPHPESHHPETPKPTLAPTYVCNASSLMCVPAKPGTGESKIVCESDCKKSNHTPTALVGLWRSFPISTLTKDAIPHEVDLNFSASSVNIWSTSYSTSCTVSAVSSSNLVLENCAAPFPPTVNCLWQSTNMLPETFEAMLACNMDGLAAPESILDAMPGTNGDSVVMMQKCVADGFCDFHFGNSTSLQAHGILPLLNTALRADSDPCHAFGKDCATCIAQKTCGWCSSNVVYKNGQPGNQCAGFHSNGTSTPFKCSGSYSTDMCYPGYVCEPSNQTCVATTPGTGLPKKDCTASCKAQPHPPPQLIGDWRGIMISNDYRIGVVEATFTSTNASFGWPAYGANASRTATVSSADGQIFLKITSGANAGSTVACIWSNDQNTIVEYIALACGGDNAAAPKDYKAAMKKPNVEFVLAKCADANCKW